MRRTLVAAVLGLFVLAACGGDGDVTEGAEAAEGQGLQLVKVGSFSEPVYVTAPAGDRTHLYVVEQSGRVIVRSGGRTRTFLDIRNQVTGGGEQGLLSLAFAPDFSKSRRFYVYFTGKDSDQHVVEFRARSATRANPNSARQVLQMADNESNHNGGLLLFGPDDKLYIGTGDGGGGGDQHGRIGNGQDLTSLLGKILRINPRPGNAGAYNVPPDNPFFNAKGTRGEIYAYGLRNPWRFSFTDDGSLAIGDVGQDEIEEIDYVTAADGAGAGANFGWRAFEGDSRYTQGEEAPGHVGPVYELDHDDGNCSVTGGVVVGDVPGARGRYLFADFCKGQILSAELATPRLENVKNTGLEVSQLSSFGVDGRGRTYVLSLGGPVYRLAAK